MASWLIYEPNDSYEHGPGLSFMWVVSINITSSILLGNSQGFGSNGYAKGKGIWPLVQGFHHQSMYAETPFYFQAD